MKRKVLACVLACATLFLGMGYAYWTNSLQIDTTATTGELNVKFVDFALYGQYDDEDNGWAIFDGIKNKATPTGAVPSDFFERGANYNVFVDAGDLKAYQDRIKGYTTTSFSGVLAAPTTKVPAGTDDAYVGADASNGINVTLNKLYPGYAQLFRTDILNIGTLAAKLSGVSLNVTNVSNNDLKDMIGISLKVLKEEHSFSVFDTANLTTQDYFTVNGLKFIRLSALTNVKVDKENLLYIFPDKNNTMDAVFGIAMDPDYAGTYTTGHIENGAAVSSHSDANTQNGTAKFTIKFLWDQFNTTKTNTPS